MLPIYKFTLRVIGIVLPVFTLSCDQIEKNRQAFSANAEKNATSSAKHLKGKYSGAEVPAIPASVPSQIKEYEGYIISFNKETGNPNWSAWELTSDETDGTTGRSGKKFWQDSDIEGCVTTTDYTNSGYDRGHLCPAADMKWSEQAMNDCFSMANITPQDHALNSGAWSTLEKKCRLWAQRDGSLLIAAGPIYEGRPQTIAGGKVKVPSAFFKVIVAADIDEPRGIAFVYPNASAPGNMVIYAMSIDEVEKMTGFDFFPKLPDDLENRVESTFSFRDWNRNSKK